MRLHGKLTKLKSISGLPGPKKFKRPNLAISSFQKKPNPEK
jgi:hypothetical protein